MRTPGGSVAEMHFLSRLLPRRAARRSPDEAIAERLLTGQDAGPGASPAQHALELALLAAARPGTERELSGESAAVAAFVQARQRIRRARRAQEGAVGPQGSGPGGRDHGHGGGRPLRNGRRGRAARAAAAD